MNCSYLLKFLLLLTITLLGHRPVLHPMDLSEFDKLISPHEYAAISENRSLDDLQLRGNEIGAR